MQSTLYTLVCPGQAQHVRCQHTFAILLGLIQRAMLTSLMLAQCVDPSKRLLLAGVVTCLVSQQVPTLPFLAMVQAMDMSDKPDETEGMADGDEGTPGGEPLPTPAQFTADLQSAHAALEEEEERDAAGRSQIECTARRGPCLSRVHCIARSGS